MDYEKKYKEAQKWIESIYPNLSHEQQMEAEAFFPELAESEDERIRKEIIKYLERTVPHHHRDEVLKSKEWIAWLEKQGERKPQRMVSAEAKEAMYDKPACAWSEEDEHRVKDTIYFLDTAKKHYASTVELDACINWLKSLKQRCTWKPGIAQLNALSIVSKGNAPDDIEATVLLYNDLKKLTE